MCQAEIMSHLVRHQAYSQAGYYNVAAGAGISAHGKAGPVAAVKLLHIFRPYSRYNPYVDITAAVPRPQGSDAAALHINIKIGEVRMGAQNACSTAAIGS